MSTLHTINKSPYTHNTLSSCLKVCTESDGILLLEDGVFGATLASPCAAELQKLLSNGISIFALEPDVKARGIAGKLAQGIQLAGYDQFVQLTLEHRCVQSWY